MGRPRRTTAFGTTFALSAALLLLPGLISAQTCTINPSSPVGVPAGGTYTFSASCGSGLQWTVTGQGSIDSGGHYAAPVAVTAKNQSRGCQALPNNSPFNIPVDALPVDSHSSRWLTRISQDGPQYWLYHAVRFAGVGTPGFFDNVVDNSTRQQLMHFYYSDRSNGYQDTDFPVPDDRDMIVESGRSLDSYAGYDQHMFTLNKDTCQSTEVYAFYADFESPTFMPGNPTRVSWNTHTVWALPQDYGVFVGNGSGAWAQANGNWRMTITGPTSATLPFNSSSWGNPNGGMTLSSNQNGCPQCNSAGGQKWRPDSYAQLGGTDAASMPVSPLSTKLEEWYAATQTGRSDLGHALRTTMSNSYLSARNIWPAVGYAYAVAGFQNALRGGTNTSPATLTTQSDMSPTLPCDNFGWINGIGTFSIANGGSGYNVGDTLTVNGGTSGVIYVTAVGSNHSITSAAIDYRGSGYSTGTHTVNGGSGSGASINVSAVTPTCQFHVNISNLSGSWSAANGDWIATSVDNLHFTIPVDGRTLGSFPTGGMAENDFIPYGATLRLKSSFDVNTLCTSNDLTNWCPYAKVLINTVKKYGMIVSDGTIPSDNWDTGVVSSDFHPDVLRDAASKIFYSPSLQPLEQYLEVVDRSSQQVSNDLSWYQLTNTNRTQVKACGSNGCASDDVMLQGTTIGTDRERLAVAGGVSYPLNVWVNGNVNRTLNFAVDLPGASVTSEGVLTMPGCTMKERGMVTVSSSADPHALPLYIDVTCVPVSADGAYRLALGNYSGDYLDSTNKTWWGSWGNEGFNNGYEVPGLWWGSQNGTWEGTGFCANDTWTGTDSELFSRSTDLGGDTRVEVIVPNGSYTVTLYGEPGFGGFGPGDTCGNSPNRNVYDWQVQDQIVNSWVDGYVQAGNQPYHGYTLTAQASVTDNILSTTGRIRVPSVYGMSWSSLLITGSTSLQASFTFSPTNPIVGQPVQFTDTSTGGPTSWSWDFGDRGTSNLRNPSHAYTAVGSYTVTLTVTNASGRSQVSHNVTVNSLSGPQASFTYSPSNPTVNQPVQFTDTSTGDPTSWSWNFGDNGSSNQENPSHNYTSAGTYTVTLTVSNSNGQSQVSHSVTVRLTTLQQASFTFNPTSPAAGQPVQFTDTSTGGPRAWSWDFGDTSTSNIQNPSHTYASGGTYVVTLTVTFGSLGGNRQATHSVTVSGASGLQASFTISPANLIVGQPVQFTDTSSGGPTSWSWNFGDTDSSTLQNPSHAYSAAGSYTVTLRVSNSNGQSQTSRTVSVGSGGGGGGGGLDLHASFAVSPFNPLVGQPVQFTDNSTGGPTSWFWTFGDGSTSTLQNPSYAYSAAGIYTVSLTVSSSLSSSAPATQTLAVTPSSSQQASFIFSPASPSPGENVQFTDTSKGSPTSWSWTFGDGTTSILRNPSHVFSGRGPFLVGLTTTGPGGSSWTIQRLVLDCPGCVTFVRFR